MTTGLPFDDIRALIRQLPSGDAAAADRTRAAFAVPDDGKSDRLRRLAVWLSLWTGRPPAIGRPLVAIFGAAHGIAVGLSAKPAVEPSQYVKSAAAGELPLNRLCKVYDLGLQVYDLALDVPTADMSVEPALDEKACAATMAFGMEAVAGGVDLLCLGSFGSGDELAARAILSAMEDAPDVSIVEKNPRSDEDRDRSRVLIETALALHAGHFRDPLEILRRLGGREFAALAGAIVAARTQRMPVVLEGVAALAAAAILRKSRSDAVDHCHLAALPTSETAFRLASICEFKPLLDESMSADCGMDAAFAAIILKGVANSAPFEAAAPGGR